MYGNIKFHTQITVETAKPRNLETAKPGNLYNMLNYK
jgi:hypothetical protein